MFFDREVLKEVVEEIYVDKYVERVVSASTNQSDYFSIKGPSGCALTKVPKATSLLEMRAFLRARARACVRACVRAAAWSRPWGTRQDSHPGLLMFAMTDLTSCCVL